MSRLLFAVVGITALSACSSVNTPSANSFPVIAQEPSRATVFLDANGSFYPTGWLERIGEKRIQRKKSLLNALAPAERQWLSADEDRQLETIRALAAGKERVFVLTHGFNINEKDAASAFERLESRIKPSERDAIIRVHWDGMLGSGAGAGAVWFPATGYSQMVGARGFRSILNQMTGQDVILISHSRGASVILSALGDPPFDPDFRAKTERLDFGPGIMRFPELAERQNRFHVIMLGAAIGFPDFWTVDCEKSLRCGPPVLAKEAGVSRCPEYRAFTPQLRSIHLTLNPGDTTLRKLIPSLSPSFNATNLGWDPRVSEQLKQCYGAQRITSYTISAPHKHPFIRYAADPEVAQMLRAVGVSSAE
jgi:hypothetical protein